MPREWWRDVAFHPIGVIVANLRAVPAEDRAVGVRALAGLPQHHPHTSSPILHREIETDSAALPLPETVALAPLYIHHATYLFKTGRRTEAAALFKRMVKGTNHENGMLLRFIRHLTVAVEARTGRFSFAGLRPIDIFLGACYYDQGVATRRLESSSSWEYRSVERELGNDSQALNDFRVRGLQPRIAELVFAEAHRALTGEALRDLNAEAVMRLPQQWSLDARNRLPAADFLDSAGQAYDVKCNIFYRSRVEKVGIRGFLIQGPDSKLECLFPGIIFTDTTDSDCAWAFVGYYRPSAIGRPLGSRILPFYFSFPGSQHLPREKASTAELNVAATILSDPTLKLGWRLFAARGPTREIALTPLHARLTQTLLQAEGVGPPEYALWTAVTQTTLEGLSTYAIDEVRSFLEDMEAGAAAAVLPAHSPRVGQRTLLNRWITDVLLPLVDHWPLVSCTACRAGTAPVGSITVSISRMSSEGAVEGMIVCKRCGHARANATIITHCFDCGHFPLVIGQDATCEACEGLRCGWRNDAAACGSCKRWCAGAA